MGLFASTEFKDTHILHCTKFCDNKVYVYLPYQDKFYTFSIVNKEKKFRFFAQETITISSNSLYIIGGQTAPSEEDFHLLHSQNGTPNLYTTNFVAKINLKKHENFQVDLAKMKPCRVLPEARTSHLMVYSEPYIFVIGGYLERNVATRTCLRFHKKKKTWEYISELGFTNTLTEPCGLAIKDCLYVFDTAAKGGTPRIYKYSIELNSWMEILIQHRSKGLSIPPSINCAVYQVSDKELMILSGLSSQNSPKGFYYTYNIDTEELSDMNIDESLGHWKKEKQGNLDYVNSDMVYVRLSGRSVRAFRKSDRKWLEIEHKSENSVMGDFGCCSRRS